MPPKIPDRERTQLRLNEILFRKAKIIAQLENRTMNSQFEYFIRMGIEKYEAEHGEIILPDDFQE